MGGLVRLEGVSRVHGGTPPIAALKPCDLQIASGDYVAVTGPSGSGKTTLLNILGLLDSPTQGRYLLGERDLAGLSDRDRAAVRSGAIGFVFQAFHLLAFRSAMDNVAMSMLYSGVPRRERWEPSENALVKVGLGHRLHAFPHTMSGGEQQRVAIARAIVKQPQLLLCDEPTGNLDSASAASVLGLLDQLHADGHTLVVVTHNPTVASRATKQIELVDGIIIDAGEAESGGRAWP